MNIRLVPCWAALVGALVGQQAHAQRPGAGGPPPPPPAAEQAALLDLTGYWVSVIDQDWAWRMMTPPKGNLQEMVPLNAAGRRLANEFNPELYGGANYQLSGIVDCRAYGAGGLMRMPTRLHITWASPNELKIESDWGEQTRMIHFVPGHPFDEPDLPLMIQAQRAEPDHNPPSLQGHSVAVWQQPYDLGADAFSRGPRRAFGFGLSGRGQAEKAPGGDLAVVTTNLAPAWLWRNGAPYGSQARIIEYYDTFEDPTGARWFNVSTEVIDEEYLTAPDLTSANFMREPDGSKWAPHPCKQVSD